MSDAIYTATAASFTGVLTSLGAILAQAAERQDAASLPAARLAPDMFPLSAQVQLTCYHATDGTAPLRGLGAPGRPALHEADLASLQALVAETAAQMGKLTAADFAGAETRQIMLPLQPTMVLDIDGVNYVHSWLLPNFYFHYVMAYDILRHKGLGLGKKDYLAHLAGFMRQTG
jgi:uncharacterized protein